VHNERTRRIGARKYLRENCCHRIKYFAANFLAAFMWRRPLNSAILAIQTHRRLEKVSDGTSTRVGAWMINKWRIKIMKRGIYNARDPWGRGDWKNK